MLRSYARLLERQQRRAAEVSTRADHRGDELDDALVRQYHAVVELAGAQDLVRSALLGPIARIDAVHEQVGINEACHACTDPLVASRARWETRPEGPSPFRAAAAARCPRRRAAAAPLCSTTHSRDARPEPGGWCRPRARTRPHRPERCRTRRRCASGS